MASERNWTSVKIGNTYLTHNGLITGVPCKVVIPTADELLDDDVAVNIVEGAGGVPNYQVVVADSYGIAFEIQLVALTTAVFNALRALLKATRDNDPANVARFIATGTPGTIDRNVKGDMKVMSFKSFSAGQVNDVVIRLRTYGLGGI
ncbi:MAG: hypothetical protein MSG64_06340 [Pyrinomonadaceae bacterium MAG19_C2-C3]|nr:hypothetical protein [Pyrinomonadaceae bacterium MAG19_C2-C3]